MSPFLLSLTLTLLLFGAVCLTGLFGLRGVHLFLVVVAVASLGVTIYFAEKLGELYDLQAAGTITPVHLTIAKLATLALLGPLVTGTLSWRNVVHLRKHRVTVFLFLGLVVLALGTGTWMILASTPL